MLDAILHSELGLSLTVLAIGFCSGLGLMRLAPTHDTDFASLAASEWPTTWGRLAISTWSALAPQWWPWALLAAAAVGTAACCVPALRKEAATNARAAAAAIAAAALVGLFIGTRHWVVANGYAFRFLLPSALMVQAALFGVAVAPLARLIRNPASYRFGAVALALVLSAAAFSYGRPSLAGVYRDLDPYYYAESNGSPPGISTRELLDRRCTHVAGDYWTVWHAVFRANLALYERGERRTVWGIAERCGPTHRYWSRIPRAQLRVAVTAGGDLESGPFLDFYQLAPLAVAEQHATLWLLRPAELVAPELAAKGSGVSARSSGAR